MQKLKKLIKIFLFSLRRPKQTLLFLAKNIEKQDNSELKKKEYLEKKYGFSQIPTIDLLDLLPGFNETVDNYSFLTGTSGILDIALLKALARRFDDCQYLEIGSWRGESIANVAEVAKGCSAITLSDKEMREMNLTDDFIEAHGFFSKKFKNITMYYHNSATFDFSKLPPKFDLIFVDGDHSYNGVRTDSQNVFKLLKNEESIIVWHDYALNPETVRYSVLAGILDGLPETVHKNLFHVSNTICTVYIRKSYPTRYIKFPDMPNKSFQVKIISRKV